MKGVIQMNNIVNYQSGINFNGRVDRKSVKLAKKLGGDVLENLEQKAKGLSKNTVLTVTDGADRNVLTGIYAYNTKLGTKVHVDWTNNANLASAVEKIDPAKVEEKIVDESIKHIKQEANTYPLRGFARKMLKADAKEVLNIEREFGINKPFWGDAKKLMTEAEERAARERVEYSKKHDWAVPNKAN